MTVRNKNTEAQVNYPGSYKNKECTGDKCPYDTGDQMS